MSPPANIPSNDSDDGSRSWGSALGHAIVYWLWSRWRTREEEEAERESGVDRGHEDPEDANVGGVVALSTLLLVLIGGCLIGVVGLFWWFAGEEEAAPSRFADVERVPPPPRLQHDPAVDLAQLHKRTSERLHTYGWVDRSRNVVHIPIQRAMTLLMERGLLSDTAVQADTGRADSVLRVISESGYAWERRGPPPPSAPAFLGRSPEPFTPSTPILRALGDTIRPLPNWERRVPDSTTPLYESPNQ